MLAQDRPGECSFPVGWLAGEVAVFFGVVGVGELAPGFVGFVGEGAFGVEGDGSSGADTVAGFTLINLLSVPVDGIVDRIMIDLGTHSNNDRVIP